jgi:hypothetical protein
MLQHKCNYRAKALLDIMRQFESMLCDLKQEIRAGKAPEDFKTRIDSIYNKATCKYDSA